MIISYLISRRDLLVYWRFIIEVSGFHPFCCDSPLHPIKSSIAITIFVAPAAFLMNHCRCSRMSGSYTDDWFISFFARMTFTFMLLFPCFCWDQIRRFCSRLLGSVFNLVIEAVLPVGTNPTRVFSGIYRLSCCNGWCLPSYWRYPCFFGIFSNS